MGAWGQSPSPWLLLAVVVLLVAVAALGAMIYWLRQSLEHHREYVQQQLQALEQELDLARESTVGMGERLTEVEKRLTAALEKQQELEYRDPGAMPYAQAARLIKMGADNDEVIHSCGLSRAEVELLTRIHRGPAPEA